MEEKKEKKVSKLKALFNEFKAFINRGNVMDLAVGMIIGSAFTAVVTSLVKNILTPLINWIPGTGNTGALQTVLREAVLDENGQVLTEALIIDWGSVISAVITFLLTALVLFVIVKAFNKLKEVGKEVQKEVKTSAEKLVEDAKNKGKNAKVEEKAEVKEEKVEEKAEETPAKVEEKVEETPAKAEEAPAKAPTTEELLQQIVELLKENKA